MNQKPCQFYSFLQAVRGNWRNALFIRCSGSLCPMIRQASCEGFLMATDASCQPIFLSVQTVRKLSGEAVDPEECSAILECRSFRTAYTKFLEWHTSSDHVCPFLQLCPDRDTSVSYTHLDVYKRQILTPDLKGINYLKAHQPLLVDERFRFSEHMTFAGLARPFHALDEMGYIIGGFDGLLPYSKAVSYTHLSRPV